MHRREAEDMAPGSRQRWKRSVTIDRRRRHRFQQSCSRYQRNLETRARYAFLGRCDAERLDARDSRTARRVRAMLTHRLLAFARRQNARSPDLTNAISCSTEVYDFVRRDAWCENNRSGNRRGRRHLRSSRTQPDGGHDPKPCGERKDAMAERGKLDDRDQQTLCRRALLAAERRIFRLAQYVSDRS